MPVVPSLLPKQVNPALLGAYCPRYTHLSNCDYLFPPPPRIGAERQEAGSPTGIRVDSRDTWRLTADQKNTGSSQRQLAWHHPGPRGSGLVHFPGFREGTETASRQKRDPGHVGSVSSTHQACGCSIGALGSGQVACCHTHSNVIWGGAKGRGCAAISWDRK